MVSSREEKQGTGTRPERLCVSGSMHQYAVFAGVIMVGQTVAKCSVRHPKVC